MSDLKIESNRGCKKYWE